MQVQEFGEALKDVTVHRLNLLCGSELEPAEALLGIIVLHQPRTPRELNWEDDDLLKTVGLQAASYLAEEEAMRALADVREIELFNRRFAFVIHDIKTVISQMSMLVSNADKHGDNPEFRKDLVISVRESVAFDVLQQDACRIIF